MKTFLAHVFAILVILAILASSYYTGHRFRMLSGMQGRWLMPGLFMLIAVAMLAAAMAAVRSTNPVVGHAYVWTGYAFTSFLYMLVLLLVLHGFEQFAKPPPVWSGIGVVAAALVVTTIGAVRALSFQVRETTVPIAKLERALSVVQLSDLHLGHHRGERYLEQVVAATNRQKPDLVLLTGDLVDSDVALLPGVLEPLKDLDAPTFFVSGNHDKTVAFDRALELIAATGVRILHNEIVEIHGIQVVGLDYMNADEDAFDMHPSEETRTIKSTLSALPLKANLPTLLMHHSPVGLRYAEAAGVDLAISGHTHAGQIFPFTWLTEFVFPFNRGLHHQGKTAVFVSEGAGTYLLRARLGSANEINLLRLVPANADPR